MDLPNDLAVKTLLLEQTCDLERQFGEKYLVIWTGIQIVLRAPAETLRSENTELEAVSVANDAKR